MNLTELVAKQKQQIISLKEENSALKTALQSKQNKIDELSKPLEPYDFFQIKEDLKTEEKKDNEFKYYSSKLKDWGFDGHYKYANFSDLIGQTLVDVVGMQMHSDCILFTTTTGRRYVMYHEQDCCESVTLEDVNGDYNWLLNNPIIQAEEVVQKEKNPKLYDSVTWTFYKLATIKGYINLRWFGESNGYYSEEVDFVEIAPEETMDWIEV